MTTDTQRKRRLAIFGGLLLVGIVVVALVIGLSGGSDKTSSTTTPAATSGGKKATGASVKAEFAGIPQKSNVLGAATAKAKLVVFADLQCPFCAQFENKALPVIVKRYVRPGKLQVVFQPIAILGNDSVLGARASAAAAQQNKMFDFNASVYRNQGEEGSGYMTVDWLKRQASAAGLDAAKLQKDLSSPASAKLATEATTLATSGHVQSTPSFFIAKNGQSLQQLSVTSLDASGFTKALDAATA